MTIVTYKMPQNCLSSKKQQFHTSQVLLQRWPKKESVARSALARCQCQVIQHKCHFSPGRTMEGLPFLLKVCKETEKCLMTMLKTTSGHLPQCSGLLGAISTSLLAAFVESNIFESLTEHMYNCTATNNHVSSLIKCCGECYIHIRTCMYRLGKIQTEKIQGKKVRKQFSKLILFNNQ